MVNHAIWSLIVIFLGIVFIIISTSKVKLHTFFVLIIASYLVGLLSGMPLNDIVESISKGFGDTLSSIGIVIAAGAVIGVFLERSNGALSISQALLRVFRKSRSPLSMAITGYLVSIAVFCDSGFVILSPLNKALAKETKISLVTYAVALSLGLYSTHTFVPPTPGPLASAGILGADTGSVIILGLIVAGISTLIGYVFSIFYASKFEVKINLRENYEETKMDSFKLPSPIIALSPIIVPILLIVLKSFSNLPVHPLGTGFLKSLVDFFGHPVTALMMGVFFSFILAPNFKEPIIGHRGWVGEGLANAAMIILITGAGGSLGTVLRNSPIMDFLTYYLLRGQLTIFLPFLLAAVLKTAQGSSTVAMVTTASMIAPILGPLGLSSPIGRVLAVLSIGAGAMIISHANDSYFWVVSQLSNMDVTTAYKTHTVGTLITGVSSFIIVLVLTLILL